MRIAPPLLALALAGGLWATFGSTPEAEAQDSRSQPAVRFVGHSPRGDLQEAIDDALLQADRHFQRLGADILYEWGLRNTRGRRGGFAGFNDVFVTIDARGDL